MKIHGSDVWLIIDKSDAPYLLNNNPYELYFTKFVFLQGLGSPLALVAYRHRYTEKFLRLDVQKRAFVIDFDEEKVIHFFEKEIAPALLGYLEKHSDELTALHLSLLLEAHPARTDTKPAYDERFVSP